MSKQIIREAAQEARIARKAGKKAYHQSELALLEATPILRFYGQLVVEPRESALLTATELSQQHKEDRLVYFADGAVANVADHLAERNKGSQDIPKERRRTFNLAAAVAPTVSETSECKLVSFSVLQGGKK